MCVCVCSHAWVPTEARRQIQNPWSYLEAFKYLEALIVGAAIRTPVLLEQQALLTAEHVNFLEGLVTPINFMQ